MKVLLKWEDVALLGIDVGYSERAATTGIASYRFGHPLDLRCVRFTPAARKAALADGHVYDAVAIDGPLLPNQSFAGPRECERILSRGMFGKRCKAGFSHFGEGAKLRAAAATIASESFHKRQPNAPLVEGFPNAFLGVMLDDQAYAQLPRPIPRGRKSDLFYARALQDGCLDRLFACLGWHDETFKSCVRDWATPQTRIAHEYRAAIVCILTAACAHASRATYVGDASGGYICLPPAELWAKWAHAALGDVLSHPTSH